MTNDTSLESSCTLLLESAKKQRFSLLQAKAVIQAVCLMTQAVSIKARYVRKVRKFQQPQTNAF